MQLDFRVLLTTSYGYPNVNFEMKSIICSQNKVTVFHCPQTIAEGKKAELKTLED